MISQIYASNMYSVLLYHNCLNEFLSCRAYGSSSIDFIILFISPLDAQKILCQICDRCVVSKYKRHLQMHRRQGKISSEQLTSILFQTRYTRRGSKMCKNSIRYGVVCTVVINENKCLACVIDLPTHLNRIHKLYFPNTEYIAALQSGCQLERRVFFREKFKPKQNALYDIEVESTGQTNGVQNLDIVESSHFPNSSPEVGSSVFDFSSIDTEYSCDEYRKFTLPNDVCFKISRNFLNCFKSYEQYLPTVSGGSRSMAFSKWM